MADYGLASDEVGNWALGIGHWALGIGHWDRPASSDAAMLAREETAVPFPYSKIIDLARARRRRQCRFPTAR